MPESASERWEPWVLAAGLVVLALAVLPPLRDALYVNHDVVALGLIAERMLDGDVLYVEIQEPNPPLVIWLFALPVALARALGQPWPLLLQASVIAWTLAGVGLFLRALHAVQLPALLADRRALAVMVLALHGVATGYHLGQREQLAVVALLPLLVSTAGAWTGRPLPRNLAIAVGTFGALGLALKPYFPPWWALGELLMAVATRSPRRLLRTETIVGAVVLVLYALATVTLTEWLTYVPMWLRDYSAYDVEPTALVEALKLPWIAAALAPWVLLRRLPDASGLRPLDLALAIAVFPALASAWVQGKGFSYHAWPALVLSATFAATALTSLVPWGWARRGALVAVALGASLTSEHVRALVPGHEGAIDRYACTITQRQRSSCSLRALVDHLAPHVRPNDRAAWFSTSAIPTTQVVARLGLRMVNRTSTMRLPASYTPEELAKNPFPYHPEDALPDGEREVRDGWKADLLRDRPELILIDRRARLAAFGTTAFDALVWMRQDPELAQLLDSAYTILPDEDATHGTITVWIRRDRVAAP